ncbi:copper-binding transcription factor [Rhodotorula kratochvilovae]
MVLIDGTKYACQSCIKGHRSSKCTHTSRPLTEIKKKGRPTSQCTHCRELRKTKSVHGRCDCAAREAEQKPTPRLLPNGLADAVATPEPDEPALTATEPSGVTRLLNPCNCLRGGKCTCCTVVKRGAPKAFPQDAGASPVASTSSSGGCCSSSAPLTSEALFVEPEPVASALPTPPPLDFTADIPVTPLPAFSSPAFTPSYTPSTTPAPAPSTQTALFLPPTHGTHACFCGPTCACVGCAVHDPYARKRPAPGACAGGGCRCGTEKGCEGGGKRVRVTPPGSVGGGGGGGGCCGPKSAAPAPSATVKSCCGSGKRAPSAPAPPQTSGIELPSLWAHRGSPDSSTSAAEPLPHFAPATPTSNPLPSLRTLYPALLDLELALPTPPAGPAPSPQALDPAALARELSLAPRAAPAEEEEERADCSAVYLQEPLDDACGSGGAADGEDVDQGGCHCSSACGCRAGLEHGEEQEDADEGELGRLAELAALGAFG